MENKTLTCPSGKEVVIKGGLSAGDRNRIRDVVLGDMQIDPETFGKEGDKVTGIDKISGAVFGKQQKITIESLVISYDGSADNIYKRLEDQVVGDGEQYDLDFIIDEINKITPKKAPAK